jgi:tetraacyldisaccharide-1-P 4'-kinase
LKASYALVDAIAFSDHHRYTPADVAAIDARVKASGADAVFTTDKDAVRLDALALPFNAYRVPLQVRFDPPDVLMASVLSVLQ